MCEDDTCVPVLAKSRSPVPHATLPHSLSQAFEKLEARNLLFLVLEADPGAHRRPRPVGKGARRVPRRGALKRIGRVRYRGTGYTRRERERVRAIEPLNYAFSRGLL